MFKGMSGSWFRTRGRRVTTRVFKKDPHSTQTVRHRPVHIASFAVALGMTSRRSSPCLVATPSIRRWAIGASGFEWFCTLIEGIDFSADGQWLATAGWDQSVKLRDVICGQIYRIWHPNGP